MNDSGATGRFRAFLGQDVDVRAFHRGLGVFAVVLVALAMSWGATQGSLVQGPARADAGQYLLYAWNLKYEGVYSRSDSAFQGGVTPEPDAVRTPGYPLFLTPFMVKDLAGAFVPFSNAVKTAQSLLIGGAVLLAFFLCRMFMPYVPSLAAAGLAAISPHLANSAIYLLTESLFAFMVMLALFLMARLLKRPGLLLGVAAGLAMGYGALVRPSLIYLPLAVLPVLWLHLRAPRRVRVVAAVALGFLVVYGAWGARNLYSVGEWSDSTLANATIQHGMYPGMMYEGDPESLGVAYNYDPATERIAGDTGATLATLWERASAEPGRYLGWYLFGKPATFWQWDIIAGMGDVFIYPTPISAYNLLWPFKLTHAISYWLHWPAVLLGALGCLLAFIGFRRRDELEQAGAVRLVAATLIYFTLLHMVGAPYPRYSIPLRPELFAMAALAVWLGARLVQERLGVDFRGFRRAAADPGAPPSPGTHQAGS